MRAMIIAIILTTKTAAAAKSFILPACTFCKGETKSTSFSMAVLIISRLKTIATHISTSTQSTKEIWRNQPSKVTNMVEIECNLKLRSPQAHFKPLKAYPKDFSIECFFAPFIIDASKIKLFSRIYTYHQSIHSGIILILNIYSDELFSWEANGAAAAKQKI